MKKVFEGGTIILTSSVYREKIRLLQFHSNSRRAVTAHETTQSQQGFELGSPGHLYTTITVSTGVRGVMVIVAGNGHSNTSSNTGQD